MTGFGRDRVRRPGIEGGSIEQVAVFVSTSADREFKPIALPGSAAARKIEGPRFELAVAPGARSRGPSAIADTGRPIAGARII